jgi:hypothetical protein
LSYDAGGPQGVLNKVLEAGGRTPPQVMTALTDIGTSRVLLRSVISTSDRFLILENASF